jgi:hypothetical protein
VTLPEESPGSGDEDKVEAGEATAEAPTEMFQVDELNDATKSTVEPQAAEPEPSDEIAADEPTQAAETVAAETAETTAAGEPGESADEILARAFGALRGEAAVPDNEAPAEDAPVPDDEPAAEVTRVDKVIPASPSVWTPAPKPKPAPVPTPAPAPVPNVAQTAMIGAWAKEPTPTPMVAKSGQDRPRWMIPAAVGTAAVLVIAVIVVVVSGSSHHTTISPAAAVAASKAKAAKAAKAKAAEVANFVSISPDDGSTSVNGAAPITVTYSHKLASDADLPTLSPSISGSWKIDGNEAIFTPSVGYSAGTRVTVHIPATTSDTTTTTDATTATFTTGQYSTIRLEQLLAQLGYLPVTWTASAGGSAVPSDDANAQLSAAYDPPSGTFTFDSGYPSTLRDQWSVGSDNEVLVGAVRTFEYDQNLTMDGDAGPEVWSSLLTAVAKNQTSQHGYTYVYVQQGASNEYLDLYHDGKLAITTPANTGIPASPTVDGTYPVYLRYTVTQMTGKNPDGTPYDDTVYWVSYFNGGDAVHAYPRPGYGYYQSLGCVELPYNGSGPGVAENVWNLITYGTLVTVAGPVA